MISGVGFKTGENEKQDNKVWAWLLHQYTLYISPGFFLQTL